MEGDGLRRKDTTRGPPLRILSLDGGGVRGYSLLIILQEIMHRTFVEIEGRAPRRNEIPKPCEHFDLIVGTGTGGLIALMLGRLRMDIETCKDVYVRMTRRVFETDKTIAGIPYRSTLFKASKLEEAIRDCVREHTIYESEGNDQGDEPDPPGSPMSTLPMRPGSAYLQSPRMERSASTASRYSQIGTAPMRNLSGPYAAARYGKPNALLYDARENRTKTAVTAVYKSSTKATPPALLRSYDSRREPPVEGRCTIWQAGRATSATALAFKPIHIGQSIFLDEGSGKFNPSPIALDEAVLNEWPGRQIGVLMSVGTGKRPSSANDHHQLWWEDYVSSSMGDFAEARRKLISKIEGCEETHKYMVNKHLLDRGVPLENYYRLNVDVGVGEFGMNEWNRLAEISTNTRKYLAQSDVKHMTSDAARKMGAIHRANVRWNRAQAGLPDNRLSFEEPLDAAVNNGNPPPPAVPGAVELPAEDVPANTGYQHASHSHSNSTHSSGMLSPIYMHRLSEDDKFLVVAPATLSDGTTGVGDTTDSAAAPVPSSTTYSSDGWTSSYAPDPRTSTDYARPAAFGINVTAPDVQPVSIALPPPLPPKTPLQANGIGGPHLRVSSSPVSSWHSATSSVSTLPYPDTDGPPPIVSLARKPELR